jgi:hypothetical protein
MEIVVKLLTRNTVGTLKLNQQPTSNVSGNRVTTFETVGDILPF